MELYQVIRFIHQADDNEINLIIDALTARYRRLYPDWEVIFAALPLNDMEQRRAMLEQALRVYPAK